MRAAQAPARSRVRARGFGARRHRALARRRSADARAALTMISPNVIRATCAWTIAGLEGQRKLEAARAGGRRGGPGSPAVLPAGSGRWHVAHRRRRRRRSQQPAAGRSCMRTRASACPKVESAALALSALNPRTTIEALRERIVSANVERILDGVDVVVDGADNFPARYLLNDACVKSWQAAGIRRGAAFQKAKASVFDVAAGAASRRAIAACSRTCRRRMPRPPRGGQRVLGVLPGVIGLLQRPPRRSVDPRHRRAVDRTAAALRMRWACISAQRACRQDPQCPVCAPGAVFPLRRLRRVLRVSAEERRRGMPSVASFAEVPCTPIPAAAFADHCFALFAAPWIRRARAGAYRRSRDRREAAKIAAIACTAKTRY